MLSYEAVVAAVGAVKPLVLPDTDQYVFISKSSVKYPVLSPIPIELVFTSNSGDSTGTSANNL